MQRHKTQLKKKEVREKQTLMDLDLKSVCSQSKENHLSQRSSKRCRGGGSSPSMGKWEEEEVALCGWLVKKNCQRSSSGTMPN
jgi:hypothetical protein